MCDCGGSVLCCCCCGNMVLQILSFPFHHLLSNHNFYSVFNILFFMNLTLSCFLSTNKANIFNLVHSKSSSVLDFSSSTICAFSRVVLISIPFVRKMKMQWCCLHRNHRAFIFSSHKQWRERRSVKNYNLKTK